MKRFSEHVGGLLTALVVGVSIAGVIGTFAYAMTDHFNNDNTKTQEVYVRRSDQAYRYAQLGFTPVAAPTDIIIIQGSATRTVYLKRIALQGVATAAGNMPAQLIRRSAADTAACVLTAVTAGKHDTASAAATAVVSTVGTANCGSLGASAGNIGAGRLQLPASGTGLGFTPLTWEFGTRLDQSILLKGVNDFIAINLNGAAVPSGGIIDIEIETEEYL